MGPFSFLQKYGMVSVVLCARADNYAAYQGERPDQNGNVEIIDLDVTIYEERDMPEAVTVADLVKIADSCHAVAETVKGEEFRGEISAKIVSYPNINFGFRPFQVIRGGLEGQQNRGVEIQADQAPQQGDDSHGDCG